MKTKTEDIRKRVEVIDSLVRYPDGCIPFYTYELIYIIGWLLDEREEIKEKTMKTKAIKRCIDNGSDVRDALAAQVELYAIEGKNADMVLVEAEMVMGIRDTLQDLIDIQNGCPLPKYQEEYDRANASAIQLIERLGHKLNYDDYSPSA